MSIQPNRVIHRIIEQVDQSDWPRLESRVLSSANGDELLRLYRVPAASRYATPLHFWVHALREELRATDHREDLVGAACHALGRSQSLEEWIGELREFDAFGVEDTVGALGLGSEVASSRPAEVYRMLESVCRRSSVVAQGSSLMAHFWGHGGIASWRRRIEC